MRLDFILYLLSPKHLRRPGALQATRIGWHWVLPSWVRLFGILFGAALGLIYYASRIEPRWIEWRHQRLTLDRWPRGLDGYRLVQLSDLHLSEGRLFTPEALRQVVRQVNRLRPDAIVITGDFVTHFDAVARRGIAELAGLRAPDGVYGITGNHDYWSDVNGVIEAAQQAGVRMLRNERVSLGHNSGSFVLAGLDDVWDGEPDLEHTLAGVQPDIPVILLAHEPNYADVVVQDLRVTLQLSGHTHGGQIRFPVAGPLALPDLSWRYPMGLYLLHAGDHTMPLYVNRGLGMADLPIRFACRPEITIFELRSVR